MQQDFYLKHRQALFEQLPDNSVALIRSGEEQIRNRDVEHPFRVDSDFYYLSGFSEPDAVLLMVKTGQACQTVMFLREKDKLQEIWQGRRLGVENATAVLYLDEAYSIDELAEQTVELLADIDSVWISFAQLDFWQELISDWLSALKSKVRQGITAPSQICDLDKPLHELRLFKTDYEIEQMKQAAEISVKGHLAAMSAALDADYEYQVQAALEGSFKQHGSPRVAFNSIVASADNACILHYTENSDVIDKNALLLVDAGAEYNCYAGDITTTFPACGKFSTEQAALYSLVLKAQQAAIAEVQPGNAYDKAHQASVRVLTEGLVELGILKGEPQQLVDSEAYKAFFMHGTGHWLGLDVHDVGLYKKDAQWRNFEAGMVVTVEPGLYISADHADVDSKWHNIGIRIEDDILVTADGNQVLTEGLPRTVDEIESWMQSEAIFQQQDK